MHRCIVPVFVTLASAAVHTVQVGPTALTFVPQTISAVQGDTVVFELFPGHNVVEGNFDSPCETGDDGCECSLLHNTRRSMQLTNASLLWAVL